MSGTTAGPVPRLSLRRLLLDGGADEVLDLDLPAGSVLAVVGASGGDRSRLLLTIAGLLRPRSGEVLLDGRPIGIRDVGVQDEDHTLVDGLSAAENVAARVLARRDLADGDWAAITALLADLDLPESSWHNLVEQLSGGQQQRVALARALVDDPAVLCLDDPASELDDVTTALAWSRIAEAAAAGAVVVVGLPDLQEAEHADRVVRVGRP